jgi:hypothetical protein
MKKTILATLSTLMLSMSFNLFAAEVCKVSMMGRVCYEEGSPEATAAHMKGDAVADAKKKAEDAAEKKLAENK